MRVGLLSSLESGGPVEHTIALAGGLVRQGADVTAVCATPAVARRLQAAGARATVVPVRHAGDWRRAAGAIRWLGDVDVAHAQDRRTGLWLRLVPQRRRRVRVLTVHGLPDAYLPQPLGRARSGVRDAVAYRWLDAGLARRADAVVTVAEAMRAALTSRLGWPADRLVVIPNGIDVPPVATARGAVVGTLSSFTPVKALDDFLAAAARLAARRPALRFALYGSGPDEERLRARAALPDLRGRVAFPGWLPAGRALSELAVLAMPSVMEGCPLALLEAMAAGVPAVATRVGGIPEVAPPGTVCLVAPRDPAALAHAIAELLDDDGLARLQADAARRHVERHHRADTMAARTLGLYERLVRERRS